jgi:hyaluronan synthase
VSTPTLPSDDTVPNDWRLGEHPYPYTGPETGDTLDTLEVLRETAARQALAVTTTLPPFTGPFTGDQQTLVAYERAEDGLSDSQWLDQITREWEWQQSTETPAPPRPERNPSAPNPFPRLTRRGAAVSHRRGRRDRGRRGGGKDRLEAREQPLGQLTAALAENRGGVLLALAIAGVALWALRHVQDASQGDALASAWIGLSLLILVTQVLSWLDRPKTVTARQERELDKLRVSVNIPVYNEDPAALRLVAASMLAQTRLPDRVEFVDDGSDQFDYAELSAELARLPWRQCGVEFSWVRTERTPDSGKRTAQAVTFTSDRGADIFATMDSDTVMDPRAVEEGLKPFADRRVMSVAAVLLTYNASRNVFTALTEIWLTAFQLGIRGAWSRLGRVLINSGGLAFYRASVILEALPAYQAETFRGRKVHCSDDSMLTLFALLRGRTVQQPTCFAFTIMPEKISHHVRQQLRWMRGNVIRSVWWFRYLPPLGLAWWLAFTAWASFGVTTALGVWLFIVAPVAGHHLPPVPSLFFITVVGYVVSVRALMIRRSDQSLPARLIAFAGVPLIAVWSMIVLRSVRIYSIATCQKASWGTRANGAEVELGDAS